MLQSIQTFDNKKNLLLNHSWNTTTQLYLFAPKDIANYGRRPLKYDFNESFRQQLNNRLDNVNSLGGWREEDAIMTNSLAASSAIMPTTQADLINLSGFSDYWTFLLIVIKPTGNSVSPLVQSSNMSYELFSGYVLGEPVSYVISNIGQECTNPDAVLVTTHYTNFNYKPGGLVTPVTDRDIVGAEVANQIQADGKDVTSLRIDKLAGGIRPTDYYSDQMSTSPSPLRNADSDTEEIAVKYNCPTSHMSTLVDGLARSVGMAGAVMGDCDMGSPNFNYTANVSGEYINNLAHNLGAETQPLYYFANAANTNIRPEVSFTLGQLEQEYPYMDCRPINYTNRMIEYEQADPMGPNRTNMMSSMISTCMPALLASNGFCFIQMSYDSSEPSNMPGICGCCNVSNAATLYPCSDEAYKFAVINLIRTLERDLFSIIINNCGHFQVNISSSISYGETLVNLVLHDSKSEQQSGMFSVNSTLSGLCSPVIGDANVATNNQQQLLNVLRDCCASAMAAPSADVREYNI